MAHVLMQGGPLVWVIAIVGLTAGLVFLERVLHLHRARIRSDDFIRGICTNLSHGNIREAVSICEDTPGPVAYIVKTAILNRSSDRDTLREAIANAGRSEISRMERRLVVIATAAQVAPLLGLLGTVAGLIRALLAMQQKGPLVQSSDLAGWVMQALVTTAVGLVVAIPCYGAYNFLVNRVEKIVLDMERSGAEIMAFLVREAGPARQQEDGA